MKTLIASLILLGTVAAANANQSCTWIGDYWVCNGGGGQSSCTWVGDYWVCN